MDEKRDFPRFPCRIKTRFTYTEGGQDNNGTDESAVSRGKGLILDLSRSGIFIISRERVSVGIPLTTNFKIGKKKYRVEGTIVRTGLMENNPSEPARKFLKFSSKGDTYIAVKFNEHLASIPENWTT